ncbi:MAG: HlyD family type I secretion periplasmic adaptor subunit [Sulfuritalea sp.]|nr:HlyD family type I secretion periplasmic adaptor subunit [Sulfuritalea sp.]
MAASAPWWRRILRRSVAQQASPTMAKDPGAGYSLDDLDDPSGAIAFGYGVIFFGLGLTALWAIFAPLGEGITAPGVVVVESKRKVISHLTGGTVTAVKVRENQAVKEGDVLLELDAVRAESARDTVLHEYIAAAARMIRLNGELAFVPSLKFPDDVIAYAAQLGREDLLRAQEQLFRARQSAFKSEVAILQENLTASRIQATGARNQLYARRQQVESLRKELESTRPLVEEGYTPRNRLLEQERQLAELTSIASDLEARIAREGSSGAEIRLRELQRRQEYLKEVETQATETHREVANLSERLKDAEADLDRMTVRAPLSGQVVSMAAQAPGGVITPNSKLMEIVPAGDKLLIDVKVPITAASRVKPDLETDIRITSFPDTPSLIIQGRVQSVSRDRHDPSPPELPHYLARVEVTQEGINKLQGRQLRPGMSTDVVIKTGERSFMRYLMDPITRRLFESFKEP